MRHLNYNHLLYFWTVAREGSVVQAAEVLHLTPQTISGQLKLLEDTIGEPLFQRVGRGLVLTDTGRLVQQYADEIFSLGAELTQRIKSKQPGAPTAFNVGIVNSIPKLIAHRILEPVFRIKEQVRIVCLENDLEKLLGDLAIHRLDLVLSDRPIPAGLNVRAYNHELGASDVAFFARSGLAEVGRSEFPASLNQAPMLLPVKSTMLRRNLDDWFEHHGIIPQVVAEFDDSALLKVFGESGVGLFPAPTVIGSDIEAMYKAEKIGVLPGIKERFYAISPERKIRHPAVACITEVARGALFG
jgi:LysR family transcriptional activator of nhaA